MAQESRKVAAQRIADEFGYALRDPMLEYGAVECYGVYSDGEHIGDVVAGPTRTLSEEELREKLGGLTTPQGF